MLRHALRITFVALAAGLAITVTPALALEVPKAPTLERPIVDQTGTLSEQQIAALASQIAEGRIKKDYQIGILVIESLEGTAIEDYSIKVARGWGIGTKDQNNGILILVAMQDREMRIEVGRGLEGDVTDLESGRIIRNIMRPAFRNNDYYGGISGAVREIQNNVEGVPTAASQQNSSSNDGGGSSIGELIFAGAVVGISLLSWLVSMLARTKSWWLGGVLGGIAGLILMLIMQFAVLSVIGFAFITLFGFVFDYLVSKNYKAAVSNGRKPSWWAGGPYIGGGWGSGSGGGFGGGGSFGGGGFGGGGSSGTW